MIRAANKPDKDTSAHNLAEKVLMVVPAIGHALRMASTDGTSADPERMLHHMLLHALQNGACSYKDLIARRHVSAPTLSRSMDVLVQRGWVERVENPGDRRQVLLSLTPAGHAEYRAARDRMTGKIADVLAGLTPNERHDAIHSFEALQRVFGAYHADRPSIPSRQVKNLKKT